MNFFPIKFAVFVSYDILTLTNYSSPLGISLDLLKLVSKPGPCCTLNWVIGFSRLGGFSKNFYEGTIPWETTEKNIFRKIAFIRTERV